MDDIQNAGDKWKFKKKTLDFHNPHITLSTIVTKKGKKITKMNN